MMTRFFTPLVLALTVGFLSGCYELEETTANIRVVSIDDNGEEVPEDDITVQLYFNPQAGSSTGSILFAGPNPSTLMEKTTDEGFATFNFSEYYVAGQAGLVVLDVIACRGNLYGEGLIKVNEMQTNETTVVVETMPGQECFEL
ncbi:MAG: hypothetical protein CL825_00320 [Crocinitomicaceae bacterium]|jgi:hypothetical protein|nr:hypothetical protein [Crocinitomicaceae bacterium]|tara:strand:+ start:176 stop:607 length:432 start_codon:yes stop_codon:yes gene_type:complete